MLHWYVSPVQPCKWFCLMSSVRLKSWCLYVFVLGQLQQLAVIYMSQSRAGSVTCSRSKSQGSMPLSLLKIWGKSNILSNKVSQASAVVDELWCLSNHVWRQTDGPTQIFEVKAFFSEDPKGMTGTTQKFLLREGAHCVSAIPS